MKTDSQPWGMSVFRYSKEHVDMIFSYLLVNGNSIADTFECYPYQITPEHHYHDVVRLIQRCSYSIRDGVKTSDEYWCKHLEKTSKDFVTCNGNPI